MSNSRLLAAAALAAFSPFLPAQDKPNPASSPSGGAVGAVDAAALAAQAPAAGITIGVVDLAKAFEQYPKYIQFRQQLDKMGEEYSERLKSLGKRIDELRGTLRVVDPESDESKQTEFELDMALRQQQWLNNHLRDRLRMEGGRAELAIYQDLEEAIRRVAVARGVTLVLRTHDVGPGLGDPMKMPPKEVAGRLRAFEQKQVWFAAPEIDLTGDLIKLLMVPLEEGKAPAKDAGKPDEKAGEKGGDKAGDKGTGAAPKPAGEANRGGQ